MKNQDIAPTEIILPIKVYEALLVAIEIHRKLADLLSAELQLAFTRQITLPKGDS